MVYLVNPVDFQSTKFPVIHVLKCRYFQCCLLVTNNDTDRAQDSFKCRTALKYKIPVVSFDFLYECVKECCWVDPEPFFVVGETRSQLLHRGLISSSSTSKFVVIIVIVILLFCFLRVCIKSYAIVPIFCYSLCLP